MTFKLILPAATAALIATGCATAERGWNNTNSAGQGAVVGSVLGAGAGAIIAGDGDDAEGALIGAGIGAAAGYVLGNERDKRRVVGQPGYPQQTSGLAGAPFYTEDNRFYDSNTGRYYYRDPATGATYYANGERRT